METLHLAGLKVSAYPQFVLGDTAAYAATPIELLQPGMHWNSTFCGTTVMLEENIRQKKRTRKSIYTECNIKWHRDGTSWEKVAQQVPFKNPTEAGLISLHLVPAQK